MTDSVKLDMSLDDIIKQNRQIRASRNRTRGGGPNRGRGAGRGLGTNRGRGGGRGRGRGRSQSRSQTPAREGRSRSRGPRGRSQSRGPRGRSQSQSRQRSRSRSRLNRRSTSRARSTSRPRSMRRGLTPKGRAGLEEQQIEMPQLIRPRKFGRGGVQTRLRRSNSNPNLQASNVHSRLGIETRRGSYNLRRPLALAKSGISKRGRGLTTNNRYSNIGLRSDQILKEQRQNMLLRNNVIQSQTFTRSRSRSRINSFNAASQLTVSVANDFGKRRRNSVGNAGYLNKQSLAQLNNQFGGYKRRQGGPGSVKSMGSNRSGRSMRSNQSNTSRKSTQSRGRGRGRGVNRGVGRKFVNKQTLNAKLQKEIAAIQGKTYGSNATPVEANGVNFTPTPNATGQTLHQRFASP